MRERVIYYSDERTDDFAGTSIQTKRVGKDFPFIHMSPLWNALSFLLYYGIAVPIVYLVSKVYLGLRFENRRALRALRHSGFYLYGNHTQVLDGFVPSMAVFPQRAYILANADAVSLPLLKNVVMMLGVIPIPTELSGMRSFLTAVSRRCAQGGCVTIFPEAHIWPFYTDIRPFPDTSFRYAVKDRAPVVVMTTTYRERRGIFRLLRRPGMTVTFSEPMYPKEDISPKKAQAELRDAAYRFMKEISSRPDNVEFIRYIPRDVGLSMM